MKRSMFFLSIALVGILVVAQVSPVFAAPSLNHQRAISGSVQEITLEADPSTAVTTVIINVLDGKGKTQIVRVSLESAAKLGLVTLDGDGNPIINELALGQAIEIAPTMIIPSEKQNPVGSALSTFFSDIDGLDYSVIMDAHSTGNGFGVIAQVLWLTRKLEGDVSVFLALLDAKKNNDFSSFVLEDGSTPISWGQLKKAIMNGDKKGNLGVIMSNKGHDNHGNGSGNGNNNKDKNKDKGNNGNGNGKKP